MSGQPECWVALAGILSLGLLAAACGGDDGDAAGDTTSASTMPAISIWA